MDKDRDLAEKIEAWHASEEGRESFRLQISLATRLLTPKPRERLLDVGCGTGRRLQFFKREGLVATGLDQSPAMLELARRRLGAEADLYDGRPEDLPFEDDHFDLVTLIFCLERTENPAAAVAEAFRVARKRVFIGVNNAFSLQTMGSRVYNFWGRSNRRGRFFSLWDILSIIRAAGGPVPVRWATVGMLPAFLTRKASSFEAYPLVQKSPFGSFLGVVADMTCLARTRNPVRAAQKLTGKKVTSPQPCGLYHLERERSIMEARV